jgi:hypothetical protein
MIAAVVCRNVVRAINKWPTEQVQQHGVAQISVTFFLKTNPSCGQQQNSDKLLADTCLTLGELRGMSRLSQQTGQKIHKPEIWVGVDISVPTRHASPHRRVQQGRPSGK